MNSKIDGDSQIISLQQFREARRQGGEFGGGAPRVIAVTGGKGGVGKSFVAANLAADAAANGLRTLAVDADLGMADLNLMLGVAPQHSAFDVLCGAPIESVLEHAHGIDLLPGLNGSSALANLGEEDRAILLAAIDALEDDYDVCVIDTPPGIGDAGIDIAAAASHVVVVLSPEPVSLADAYACLKAMVVRHHLGRAFILPNNVHSAEEAQESFERLQTIVDRFLGVELIALPHIVRDHMVTTTCALGVPIVCHAPDSPAARAIRAVGCKLAAAAPHAVREPMRLFGNRIDGHVASPMVREASER